VIDTVVPRAEGALEPQTQAILQDIVRRESRSLLCYIGDAFPWTTAAQTAALGVLQQAVKEEAAAVTALGRYLVRRHVQPPPLGAYPSGFTSHNFVALSYLVPRLVEEEKRTTAALEQDLARMTDVGVRGAVEGLLAVKKKNLTTLAGLET
jgi:hypothetical protein